MCCCERQRQKEGISYQNWKWPIVSRCTAESFTGYKGTSHWYDLDTVKCGPQVLMTDTLPSESLDQSWPRCLLQILSWSQQLLCHSDLENGACSVWKHAVEQLGSSNDVSQQCLNLFETLVKKISGFAYLPATQQFPRILFTKHKGPGKRLGQRGGMQHWCWFMRARGRERQRDFDINSPVEVGSNCHHWAENIVMTQTLQL